MTAAISSTDNPLVKRLLTLHEPAGRRAAGQFLVEGRRAIDGFLAADFRATHLLVREGEPVPDGWPTATSVSERVARKLSSAASPPGYLAAFTIPTPPPLDTRRGGLLLVDVSDPGNVGTLIRSAAAFGVTQLAMAGGADPYGAKALQASMGGLAAVALHVGVSLTAFDGGAPLCGLVVRGGAPPDALAKGPRWLVVGGEARGIPDHWLAQCTERLTLPMPGGTESLNAAVAGSIAAYLLAQG
jgi:TrmH family RNA methyltransferase